MKTNHIVTTSWLLERNSFHERPTYHHYLEATYFQIKANYCNTEDVINTTKNDFKQTRHIAFFFIPAKMTLIDKLITLCTS